MTQRVNDVFRLIVAGGGYHDVVRFASLPENRWGIGKRQIENYISRANEKLRECSRVDRDREFGLAVEQLFDLYRAAMKAEDRVEARQVRKQLTELLGLDAARKTELTGKNGGPIDVKRTPEEVTNGIQAFREAILRAQQPAGGSNGNGASGGNGTTHP